jgi:hypothetical protein
MLSTYQFINFLPISLTLHILETFHSNALALSLILRPTTIFADQCTFLSLTKGHSFKRPVDKLPPTLTHLTNKYDIFHGHSLILQPDTCATTKVFRLSLTLV